MHGHRHRVPAVRVLSMLAAGPVLALVLAACGSSASSGSGNNAAGTTTTAGGTAAAGGSGGTTVATGTAAGLGAVLVDSSGATLYTLKGETAAHIMCTGSCATTWPPLTVAAGAVPRTGAGVNGALATTRRPDGTTQVTYDGAPLYRYSGDQGPGQANGQGVGGVWYAVQLAAASSGTASTTTSAPSGSGYGY